MYQLSTVLFLIILTFVPSVAAITYSKEEIQAFAVEHAEKVYPSNPNENIKGVATRMDSRIQIKPCKQELSFTAPNISAYSRNLTVRVRCLDSNGWSLYVPVKMQILVPILVAAGTIEQGDTLTSSSVKLAMVDKSYMRKNTLANDKKVLGAKAKQQILAGQAILNNNLCFVCKGELVTIEANTQGLSVKASGYAMSDGSFGDMIRVRNKSSKRIVNGRVTDVGKVKISL